MLRDEARWDDDNLREKEINKAKDKEKKKMERGKEGEKTRKSQMEKEIGSQKRREE